MTTKVPSDMMESTASDITTTSAANVGKVPQLDAAGKLPTVLIDTGVVNVKSYGATGDGVTNDTVALQSAIDASTGAVDLGGLTYLITATLTLKSGLILQNGTITYPTMTDDVALSATGTEGSNLVIDADIDFDDSTIEMTDPDHGLVQYDIIVIEDDQAWKAGADTGTYKQGEIARVNKVDGTTITLENPTPAQYKTSENAVVRKITPIQDIRLENIILLGNSTVSTLSSGLKQEGMVFEKCYNIVITGCRIDKMHARGIWLIGCLFCHISDCTITNAERDGLAYGVVITEGSSNITINNCTFEDGRHGVAIGGSRGVSRFITTSNCTASGMHDAFFDSHVMSDFISFTGNIGTGRERGENQPYQDTTIDGIINQGGSCVISNNVLHGMSRHGIFCQNSVAEGMKGNGIQYAISGNVLSHVAGAAVPDDGGSGIFIQQNVSSILGDCMAINSVTVTGNSISDANDAGISLVAEKCVIANSVMQCIAITGNTIKNQFASNKYAGIRINEGSGGGLAEDVDSVLKYGTIVGNVIEMDATTSGSRCIELVGSPEGFAISANTTIKGDVAVHLNSAVDISVTGNVFLGTGNTSDYVNSTSATDTLIINNLPGN